MELVAFIRRGEAPKNSDFNNDGDFGDIVDGPGLSMGVFDPLDSIEPRGVEADNITNFSGGTLE